MKAIIVLYDSLNRAYLPPYGDDVVKAPHFERLSQKAATFTSCYAGSLPCMPARRELHTGRYNFLHRNWGPLEPFDDSMPELLSQAGIYTHLVTDHAHYWEDGGATYHTRYNSWEGVRGQQGDHWKGHIDPPNQPEVLKVPQTPDGKRPALGWRQHWVNTEYVRREEDYPQNRTFRLGLEFIDRNRSADNWMLQIETFDPHEPFVVPDRFRALYKGSYRGLHFDWPRGACEEDRETVEHVRNLYRAKISLCDENLGHVLDKMDRYNLWDDTMLIVCSDHGFLLGEHAFWGKNGIPLYEEISHTPLFIWDPRSKTAGETRRSLVQTIDFAPTLLDYFGLPVPEDMQGCPLKETLRKDKPVRTAGLFGMFGEAVNVTDGRYVYLRFPQNRDNAPLSHYTLMPTNMFSRYTAASLAGASWEHPEWSFLKGCPVMKVRGMPWNKASLGEPILYDLRESPGQTVECRDKEQEERMRGNLIRLMKESDAPEEQFVRLNLF